MLTTPHTGLRRIRRSQETSLNGVGGDPLASALFGLVNTSTLNYGAFSGVRYKDISFYAQDTYKVRPRLTINYGLRMLRPACQGSC